METHDLSRRGRKARNGTPSTRFVGVRLTKIERAHLDRVAQDCRTTVADVLREAVNEFVADYGERSVFVIHKS